MKAQVLMIAGALLVALPAAGQSQKLKMENGRVSAHSRLQLENAATNYAKGLKSGNEGLVESSITYSTLLRVVAPDLDLCGVREELENIIKSGSTPAIRYKAYLATMVFENPKAFAGSLTEADADGEQFFGIVAAQASKSLLGYRAQ